MGATPSKQNHTVTSTRVVPYELRHGGQKAVHVKTASGFSSWGFGDSYEDAEAEAVAKASSLEASNLLPNQLVTIDSRMGGTFTVMITTTPDEKGHMKGIIKLKGNPDWHNAPWEFNRTEIKEIH